MNSKKRIIASIMAFILIMSLFCFTATIEYKRSYQNNIENKKNELMFVKTNMENLIASRVMAIEGLKTYIEIKPDFDQKEFNKFAAEIYESANDVVRNIFFLTDTTITHAYPEKKIKNLVGTDLSLNKEQKRWVNYVKENQRTIITAPVKLIEGGIGIIVRVPIARQGEYYGQVSIVFSYDKIMRTSGLVKLGEKNDIELTKKDEFTDNDKVVWTNTSHKELMKKDYVSEQINLYESKMELNVIPKEGFSGYSILFYVIFAVGLIVALISSILIYKLLTIALALKENNHDLGIKVNQLRDHEKQQYIQYIEIKKQKEYIEFLADCDRLTGLFNRKRFTEDIKVFIEKNGQGTILLLDIDNFKNINDTQGHYYGDIVLKHIATILRKSINDEAVVYRIGGDEFIIHLPEISENDLIEATVVLVLKALKEENCIDHIKHHITASVGIAKYPLNANSADELIKKSDIAMYQAKKDGKNRYCHFTEDLNSNFGYNVGVEKVLQNALEHNKFKLLYQPIVNAQNGQIVSLEALIRIEDSIISPAEFIPVAEKAGLIVAIGNWVIDEVCLQLSVWKNKCNSIMPIAVNVSAMQLYDGSIFSYVTNALKKYNLSPRLLEIEITESVLIENSEEMIKVLNQFRELGIRISLDDFGTGYSSISYLTYMPIDKVKIDKSLKDEFLFLEDSSVMEGIISLCHGLKMVVVTEGVETKEEYQRLSEFGSDLIQGYYFDKPLDSSEMEKKLNKNYLLDGENQK